MRHNRSTLTTLAACLVVVTGCRPTPAPDPTTELRQTLQQLVERAVADNEHVPGVALSADTPLLGLDWDGAAGVADPATGAPMTPAHPVRIASNTKTYVAAAAVRLWEEGHLDLDDPITGHLPEEYLTLLRGDGYRPEEITIRHLLTHTSGLFDHAESQRYSEAIVADPTHRWTPTEQVTAAMEWGDPHAGPGQVFSYSDTGYILLGRIIEQVSGQPLPAAARQLIGFEQLGLASTWWESLEPRPQGVGERAHQFLGDGDVFGFDPSFDLYGGGGLTATMDDLARFTRALFTGGVYTRPGTADTMLSTIDGIRARPDAGEGSLPPGAYRMGIWVAEVEGFTTYRHTGFWGTLATYVPELDLAVAVTVNQNQAKPVLVGLTRQTLLAVSSAVSTGAAAPQS